MNNWQKIIFVFLVLPLTVSAQAKKGVMHFFDSLPETAKPAQGQAQGQTQTQGQTQNQSQSADSASRQELDQLIEQYGASNLKGFKSLDDLHLKGSAQQKAWLVQRLIEYRMAYKQEAPGSNANLTDDLEWAAKQGVAYPDSQKLTQLEKSMASKDLKGRLQQAMNLPEPLRQVTLDGLISTTNDASAGAEFLVKQGNLLSPQRKAALSVQIIGNITIDPLSDKDLKNARILNQSIDYSDPKTVCRSASLFALSMVADDVSASSLKQKEYYQLQGRGLVEMKRRKISCEPFDKNPELAKNVMERAEDIGAYPRGYFAKLGAASAPIATADLSTCQIDQTYRDEVITQMNNTYKDIKPGQRVLYGVNSKGKCFLQVDGKKTAKGYHATVVLFATNGARLIDLDRDFASLQEMKEAALTGKVSVEPTVSTALQAKTQAPSTTRASSAK